MSGNKARQANSDLSVVLFVPLTPPCVGVFQSFADLVVIAKEFYPIPFRTRPSKPSASMVLRLKPRESRTLPGLLRTEKERYPPSQFKNPRRRNPAGVFLLFGFYSVGNAPASGARSSQMSPKQKSVVRSLPHIGLQDKTADRVDAAAELVAGHIPHPHLRPVILGTNIQNRR
jgi:hypothetical protein